MRLPTWLIAAALVFAAACGNDDSSQRSALGVLRLRVASPTADDLAFSAGIDDFIADANAHGGIDGHPIVYDEVQLGADPAQYAATYTAAKAAHRGPALISVFGVDRVDTAALLPVVNPDLIAYISRSDDPRFTSPAAIQTTVTLPEGQTAPDGSSPYAVEAPAASVVFHVGLDAGTSARLAIREVLGAEGHRVSFIVCADPSRGCADGVVAGKTAAADVGILVGDDLTLPADPAAFPAAISAYLDAHPLGDRDWLWVGDDAVSAAAVSRAVVAYAANHGIEPLVIVDARAFDETFRAACGAECAGRVRGIMPIKPFGDARSFLMTEVSNVYAAAHPQDPSLANARYVEGFTNAANWAAGVISLSVPSLPIIASIVRASIEQSQDANVGDLIEGKAFSPTDHRAINSAEIFGIDANGLFTYVDRVTVTRDPATLGY